MITKIISISGFSGSGKSALADFLKSEKEYLVVSVSQIVTDVFRKMISNFDKITEDERQNKILKIINKDPKLPSRVICKKFQIINKTLDKKQIVVLDGVRTIKDLFYLSRKFPIVKIFRPTVN